MAKLPCRGNWVAAAVTASCICLIGGSAAAQEATESATAPAPDAEPPATPPAAEEPVEPVPEPPPAPPPSEVRVRGRASEAEQLRRSADAVTVIDARRARQETADLGEVLARNQGISVRRSGGLGTAARFSLNGFQDDQVRFFLDGVPLERSGYAFGITNVPVNMVERIEVYRGIVPIRLGADALGGAVNLVTDPHYTSHLSASYQTGSFGTYRTTLNGRYRHDATGLVFGASAFLDSTRNDYPVDVEVTDTNGRTFPARVRRFHDDYRGWGIRAETGFVDRSWAKKLLLQGFVSSYDKEIQNNIVMTVPYGEVTSGERSYGATARYEQPFSDKVSLDLVANYAHRDVRFDDEGTYIYDWFGRRVRQKRVGGEITVAPTAQRTWENGWFNRAVVKWGVAKDHELRFSVTPAFTTRSAEDRARPAALPDPFGATRTLFTAVSGVEHQWRLFDDRLENVVFAKSYVYHATGEELIGAAFISRDRDNLSFGAGDALRYEFTKNVWAKASYEYATRLPRTDEVFGNGILVSPNLVIEPETSHNGNVGPHFELRKTKAGTFTLDLNGFLRSSQKLIVLLGAQSTFRYENVYSARAVGVESTASWVLPERWLSFDGMLTWQDIRNVSSEGAFAAFDGDRIPNRPYVFGSWGATLHVKDVGFHGSSVDPFYHGRWTHSFYRAWESQGLREYKQVVPTQLTNDVGVSWVVESLRPFERMVSTLEVDNVGNARVYDFFGVQRPGRAFFFKVTGEL